VGLYRDEAIVLRTQKLGEADRIVTLLTRDHGQLRAVAKGVRRTTSRFGSRLEPATHVDLQLHTGKSLEIVTQAETLNPYGDVISRDYQKWTVASAMLETAERFTAMEHEPALQQFLLLFAALRSLSTSSHDPSLILDAFLLRSLAVGGYAPSFSQCSRCGSAGPHRWFSLVGGGSVCVDCRPTGSATPAAETLELLTALLTGDWNGAEVSTPRSRREASGLIAAYLSWHMERNLRSLPLVERV
jgi:DNA repair protein RecO (recombination protein O)